MSAVLRSVVVAVLTLVMAVAASSTAFALVRDGGCQGRLPVQPAVSAQLVRPCPPVRVPAKQVPVRPGRPVVERPPLPPAPMPAPQPPVTIMPVPEPRATIMPVPGPVVSPEPRATIMASPVSR